MGKILIFMFEGMADYEVTFISHLLHADAGKEIMTIAYTDDQLRDNRPSLSATIYNQRSFKRRRRRINFMWGME